MRKGRFMFLGHEVLLLQQLLIFICAKAKVSKGSKVKNSLVAGLRELTSELFDFCLQLAVAGLLLGLSWIGQQKSQYQG